LKILPGNRKLYLPVLSNYLILFLCIVGFGGGAVTALALPLFQLGLSCSNYHYSIKWQTVLMLQVHLLLSTVVGLYLEGYLYLRYISGYTESVLVFQELLKIGSVLVCGLGVLTTILKYFSIKDAARKQNRTIQNNS